MRNRRARKAGGDAGPARQGRCVGPGPWGQYASSAGAWQLRDHGERGRALGEPGVFRAVIRLPAIRSVRLGCGRRPVRPSAELPSALHNAVAWLNARERMGAGGAPWLRRLWGQLPNQGFIVGFRSGGLGRRVGEMIGFGLVQSAGSRRGKPLINVGFDGREEGAGGVGHEIVHVGSRIRPQIRAGPVL